MAHETGTPEAKAALDRAVFVVHDACMEPAPLYYIEFKSGYCTILRALDDHSAREEGAKFARAWATRLSAVRPASDQDVADFQRQGGTIYE